MNLNSDDCVWNIGQQPRSALDAVRQGTRLERLGSGLFCSLVRSFARKSYDEKTMNPYDKYVMLAATLAAVAAGEFQGIHFRAHTSLPARKKAQIKEHCVRITASDLESLGREQIASLVDSVTSYALRGAPFVAISPEHAIVTQASSYKAVLVEIRVGKMCLVQIRHDEEHGNTYLGLLTLHEVSV